MPPTVALPCRSHPLQESHGRKILLARTRGKVYATDAHCFHMGGALWEGDIEDIDGHACVVCPLHRYKARASCSSAAAVGRGGGQHVHFRPSEHPGCSELWVLKC